VGALVLDAKRRVLGFNRRLLRQTGLPDDFPRPGESFAEMAQRATLRGEPAFIALGDALAQGGPKTAEGEPAACLIVTAHGASLLARSSALADGGLLITLSDGHAAEIHESNRMAHELVDHLPGAVFRRVMHADGQVSCPVVSKRTIGFFDDDAAAMEKFGGDLLALVHPADRGILDDAIEESRNNPGTIDLEFRIVSPKGRQTNIRCVGSAVLEDSGELVWDARALDIEHRVAAESDRQRVRTLLDSMVENIPFMVSVRETKTMTYVLINRAFEETFEVRREDVLAKSVTEIFFGDDRKRRRDRDREVIQTKIR
jgi:PAS domain-containing protein